MLGLVCEGGGSRTVYSCGIMDVLLENNILADYFIGVSAGIAFGTSYCSQQIGRNFALATEYMNKPEYSGFKHMLNPKNRSLYNLDYVYNIVPNKELFFDYEAYRKYPGEIISVVTNVETGEAEYLPCDRDDKHFTHVRASCALPLIFPKINIDGQDYLDGGIADSIPYKQALEAGCDKLIIVLTRPRDYIKQDEPTMKLAERYYRKNTKFVEAMRTRAKRYNETVTEIKQLQKEGKVFVFTPKKTFNVGRTESDSAKLKRLYDHGYNHAKWAINSLEKYLNK